MSLRPKVHDVVNETPVFDLKPISIGGFALKGRSAVPVGRPTLTGWVNAMQIAVGALDSSPYWIGDLVSYAEGRADWKEKLDQAVSMTGYKIGYLHNLGYVARRLDEPERQLAPTIGHAQAVASLDRPERIELLNRARSENMTVFDLRRTVTSHRRKRIIEGQATLEGMYRIIYADPAWPYVDNVSHNNKGGKAAAKYPPMTMDDIIALPVKAHAMPNSVLLMWTTAPYLLANPGPRDVLEAWGFEYKGNVVWDKVLGMPGHYGTQVCHEHLIIATRGRGGPDVSTPALDSVFIERRTDEHSEKPEDIRRWIVSHWTSGPYLELFGRNKVDGWTVFGNDAKLWAEQSE